jgi:hypothetical protein
LVGVCAAGAAVAQSPTNAQYLLTDKFVVNGGVFVMNSDVNARLNGQSTTNPDINFDDTFGKASDANRARIDALWRITPKHHVSFTYFNNSTTRNRVIDRDIQWGDLTYKAGGNVEAQSKFSVYALQYEYAFVNAPNYELAGSAGIHYTDMSLRLSGNATLTNPDGTISASGSRTRDSSLPAPLPVIGLRGAWAVSPQWVLDASAQLFKLNVDGYDGNWSNFRLGATWMFSRHMGVGLGYNRFVTRVDVDRSNFNGSLKLGYSGMQAYLTGSF